MYYLALPRLIQFRIIKEIPHGKLKYKGNSTGDKKDCKKMSYRS